jgi:hypothetical protein
MNSSTATLPAAPDAGGVEGALELVVVAPPWVPEAPAASRGFTMRG